MSKKNKAKRPKTSANKLSNKPKSQSWMNRRNAIKLLIATPIAGVTAAAIHHYDVQSRDLHDLSMLGEGSPMIVQIHDPGCQLCRRLMSNTRSALKERSDINFRVADVTTNKGKQFQQKHNVENVTLLLFNGKGKLIDTVRGVTPVGELASRFAKL